MIHVSGRRVILSLIFYNELQEIYRNNVLDKYKNMRNTSGKFFQLEYTRVAIF